MSIDMQRHPKMLDHNSLKVATQMDWVVMNEHCMNAIVGRGIEYKSCGVMFKIQSCHLWNNICSSRCLITGRMWRFWNGYKLG